ncbi:kynurenine formamidase [Nakamurella sp. UYEF19]|uniref:cyclase family protein n=1 Tax=Nakamurella sp. UYEF19 TaxID=1756392 RepID=UPI003391DF69
MTDTPTHEDHGLRLNGPALTEDEFHAEFLRLRRWSGSETDQRGTLAGLTDQHRLAALATPRIGRAVSLSMPINRYSGPDNSKPALHHMVDLGDVEAPEPSAHKDFIGLDYHGKATTHLDAVCHIGYQGELFGGVKSRDAFTSLGSSWAAVTNMSAGLLLRGVLIDLPAVRSIPWLEPGTAVHASDLLEAEQFLGLQIREHDAVLLRSGHGARKSSLGPWNSDDASAGLHVDAMPLLAERGIALLGGDGDSDVRPSPVAGVHSPIHAMALTALGMPLLDNLTLEELSVECAALGRYEFLLAVAPLVIPRGTGSPVNPIAVL